MPSPASCERIWAIVMYTPPYCPRSNAIEAMFKGMNDYNRTERVLAQSDPQSCIKQGMDGGRWATRVGVRAPLSAGRQEVAGRPRCTLNHAF